MYRSIFRFRVIYSLILCIMAFDLAASPCFSNGSVTKDTQKSSKLSRNSDCNEIDSNSRKSVSERITDSVAEKQKNKSANNANRTEAQFAQGKKRKYAGI
ncbi:TPA: hypothetical protein ACS5Y8_002978 [Salmonella enterica]